jgi:predicted ATPase
MRVLVDDQDVGASFRTKKEKALLAYLAVEAGKQHRRETLSEMLWPDRPEGYARTNLRQAMLGLRRGLGAEAISAGDEFVCYGLRNSTWLDIQAFITLVQQVANHPHQSSETCASCTIKLVEAVGLYRGDFLEDVLFPDSQQFQEWVVFHREQYFRMLLGAYQTLSDYFKTQGDYERSYHYAWQYVNVAPLEETAHRQLMSILSLSGRRSAALEQYQVVRQTLWHELGVQPSRETRELHEKILAGDTLDLEPAIVNVRLTNLPAELTSFIGREAEVSRLNDCLAEPSCRLITLVGMAGVGKTRLAVRCASGTLARFSDGVWMVSLEDVTTVEMVVNVIAQTIGLPINDLEDCKAQLFRLIRPMQVLLVLDKFEHLVQSTTGFLVELLHQAPNLKILVTTRRRLNYQSACLFSMQGLPCSDHDEAVQFVDYPAIQLFMARAKHNQIALPAGSASQQLVREICRLLDGLPLGIELAAAALRHQSLENVYRGVQRGLDILNTTFVDIPGHHQSMRAALQTSWVQITSNEREAFIKCSQFHGEFTAQAALLQDGVTQAALNSLVDQSLLTLTVDGRYLMSPILRHFAYEASLDQTSISDSYLIKLPQPGQTISTQEAAVEEPENALFWDRLKLTLARAVRHKHPAGLFLLDIRPQGDSSLAAPGYEICMRSIHERLTKALRQVDTVSYLGNGQFGIILDELTHYDDNRVVAKKIMICIEDLLQEVNSPRLQARLGASMFPRDGNNIQLLYNVAKEMLRLSADVNLRKPGWMAAPPPVANTSQALSSLPKAR